MEIKNDIIFEQKDHKGVLISQAKFNGSHSVEITQRDIDGNISIVWFTVDDFKKIAKELI